MFPSVLAAFSEFFFCTPAFKFPNLVHAEYWTRINFHSICDVTYHSFRPLLLSKINGFKEIFLVNITQEIRHKEIVNLLNLLIISDEQEIFFSCAVWCHYIPTEENLRIYLLWAVFNWCWEVTTCFKFISSGFVSFFISTLSDLSPPSVRC